MTLQIFADLAAKNPNDPLILTQHKNIVYAVQYERELAVGWMDLLRGRSGASGGTVHVPSEG